MAITFKYSAPYSLGAELHIINSNPFYNQITKGKQQLEQAELEQEVAEASELGAERYVILLDADIVGIVEFLPLNPYDDCSWLGLFMMESSRQRSGLGGQALEAFEQQLRQRGIGMLRLAVVVDNEPAHAFWKKHHFQYVRSTTTPAQLDVIIYEKQLQAQVQ
ncbi:GNAT family N-acetyltransferase [Paenibacillus sp. WLX2291]|uniref:GNAT family N-acetyltransferase n=1 Tax=Paenibacillus sp. WLX2291 TaxID=3296934 RepID=UPI0039844016